MATALLVYWPLTFDLTDWSLISAGLVSHSPQGRYTVPFREVHVKKCPWSSLCKGSQSRSPNLSSSSAEKGPCSFTLCTWIHYALETESSNTKNISSEANFLKVLVTNKERNFKTIFEERAFPIKVLFLESSLFFDRNDQVRPALFPYNSFRRKQLSGQFGESYFTTVACSALNEKEGASSYFHNHTNCVWCLQLSGWKESWDVQGNWAQHSISPRQRVPSRLLRSPI